MTTKAKPARKHRKKDVVAAAVVKAMGGLKMPRDGKGRVVYNDTHLRALSKELGCEVQTSHGHMRTAFGTGASTYDNQGFKGAWSAEDNDRLRREVGKKAIALTWAHVDSFGRDSGSVLHQVQELATRQPEPVKQPEVTTAQTVTPVATPVADLPSALKNITPDIISGVFVHKPAKVVAARFDGLTPRVSQDVQEVVGHTWRSRKQGGSYVLSVQLGHRELKASHGDWLVRFEDGCITAYSDSLFRSKFAVAHA